MSLDKTRPTALGAQDCQQSVPITVGIAIGAARPQPLSVDSCNSLKLQTMPSVTKGGETASHHSMRSWSIALERCIAVAIL